jgi:hypothetical protein
VWVNVLRPGFISINTRLSACFSVMSFPARNKYGLTASYLQICGIHFGLGSGGFNLVICAHNGKVFVPSSSRMRRSAESSSSGFCVPLVWIGIELILIEGK